MAIIANVDVMLAKRKMSVTGSTESLKEVLLYYDYIDALSGLRSQRWGRRRPQKD